MTAKHKNVLAIVIPLFLLVTLLIQLLKVPGGIILSGFFLGGMVIIGLIAGAFIVAGFIKIIIKKLPFNYFFSALLSISFLLFHYQLYSPTLKIIVPEGYAGEVNFILSNLEENILETDSHGIGYLNEWTFNKVYKKPVVLDTKGRNLEAQLVGFNPSAFWGHGGFYFEGNEIDVLSFEIVPPGKETKKQYVNTDLEKWVNRKIVKLLPKDKHTTKITETKKL